MSDILQTIIAHKQQEINQLPEIGDNLQPSEHDFGRAVIKQQMSGIPKLIAEIKPASPVTGRILPVDADIGRIAKALQLAGAAALSVLTDEHFFQGSFQNLKLARAAVDIPLLCKDFIIDSRQVRLARKNGADSFLLIAKVLEPATIQALLNEGRKYNMEALVEIADQQDLRKVLQTDAKIVGINNRDLRDFSVDLGRTFRLASALSPSVTVVSLSGFSGADVRLVREPADAVLVGSSIGKRLAKVSVAELPAAAKLELKKFLEPDPLVKLCGVRTSESAQMAIDLGADFLGLNFVPSSKRCISDLVTKAICDDDFARKQTRFVGVFQNQSADYVQNICSKYRLDFAQLSGSEASADFVNFPVSIIKGVSIAEDRDFQTEVEAWSNVAALFLFDGKTPGAGKTFPSELLPNTKKPFLIAGGINPQNAAKIQQKTASDGVDTASGIENESGEWCGEKIRQILQLKNHQ